MYTQNNLCKENIINRKNGRIQVFWYYGVEEVPPTYSCKCLIYFLNALASTN